MYNSVNSPTLISPMSGNASLSTTNLTLMANGLQSGSILMPTLNLVQAVMTQMFGSGVYSTIPTNVASLAGTWNITTQNPSLSNAYVLVTPLQQPVITSTGMASSTNLANATNDIVTNMQVRRARLPEAGAAWQLYHLHPFSKRQHWQFGACAGGRHRFDDERQYHFHG